MSDSNSLSASTVLRDARRIVVKVGSSLVTDEGRGLDRAALARWSSQIARLRAMGTAAACLGVRDADEQMADLVHEAAREGARR